MSSPTEKVYLTTTEFKAHNPTEAALKTIRFEQCIEALAYLQSPLHHAHESIGKSSFHVIQHGLKIFDDLGLALLENVNWNHKTLGPDIAEWDESFSRDLKLRDPRVKGQIYYRGIQFRLGNVDWSLNEAIQDAVRFVVESEVWFGVKERNYWVPAWERERLEKDWKAWKELPEEDKEILLGYFSVDEAATKKWPEGKEALNEERDVEAERTLLETLAGSMRDLAESLKPFHHDGKVMVDEMGFVPEEGVEIGTCLLCQEMLRSEDVDTEAEHRPVQVICGPQCPHVYGRSCLSNWLADEHERYLRDEKEVKAKYRQSLNPHHTTEQEKSKGKEKERKADENSDTDTDTEPPKYFSCPICPNRPLAYRHLVTYPSIWEARFHTFHNSWLDCDNDDERLSTFSAFIDTLPPRPPLNIASMDVEDTYKYVFGPPTAIRESLGKAEDVDIDAIENEFVDLFLVMMWLVKERMEKVVEGDWGKVRELYGEQVRVFAGVQMLNLRRHVGTLLREFESGGAYGEE